MSCKAAQTRNAWDPHLIPKSLRLAEAPALTIYSFYYIIPHISYITSEIIIIFPHKGNESCGLEVDEI